MYIWGGGLFFSFIFFYCVSKRQFKRWKTFRVVCITNVLHKLSAHTRKCNVPGTNPLHHD